MHVSIVDQGVHVPLGHQGVHDHLHEDDVIPNIGRSRLVFLSLSDGGVQFPHLECVS